MIVERHGCATLHGQKIRKCDSIWGRIFFGRPGGLSAIAAMPFAVAGQVVAGAPDVASPLPPSKRRLPHRAAASIPAAAEHIPITQNIKQVTQPVPG